MFKAGICRCATLVALGFSASSVLAQNPLPPEIEKRFAEMEAEIARLRAANGENWLTEQRAQQIRSVVQDVLADADTRASLLQSGVVAGWDNGFFMASADGNNRLTIGGNIQFRGVYNRQDEGPGDNNRGGFENTRTQIFFTGHIVDPSWIYRVQGNFNRAGGTFFLEDAFIGKALGNGWTFLAGQFRVPMLREFLVIEPRQQFVERSLVHQEFTAARTQGVALDYQGDRVHFTVGYTDGHPFNAGFVPSTALSYDTEYAVTARAEALVAGEWSQFADFSSWPDQNFGLLLGGAVHVEESEFGTPATELEVLQWTLDASAKFGRINLFGAVVGRHIENVAGLDLDQYGAVFQGGVFVSDTCELFARYEWGDDDLTSPDLSIITAGFAKYFSGHRVKWTSDIGYGLNEVTSTWGGGFVGVGGDLAGWRTDSPGKNGQIVARSQLQLWF